MVACLIFERIQAGGNYLLAKMIFDNFAKANQQINSGIRFAVEKAPLVQLVVFESIVLLIASGGGPYIVQLDIWELYL